MTDAIIIIVVLLIVGGALWYIRKAKKSGKKCIGCPDGCSCSSAKNTSGGDCCCGCSGTDAR